MNKQEFKKTAKEQVDLLFEKIEKLEAKKDSLSSEVSEEYQSKINQL